MFHSSPCVLVTVLYCLHTRVMCGSRLERGLTSTSAFLAAGGHTPTILWEHALKHAGFHTQIHTLSHTHLLADNTIETACPWISFLCWIQIISEWPHQTCEWKTGAQLKLRNLAGAKKPLSLQLSHPGIQIHPTVAPRLMKRFCSCGRVGTDYRNRGWRGWEGTDVTLQCNSDGSSAVRW